MMGRLFLPLVAGLAGLFSAAVQAAPPLEISSPDGTIVVDLQLRDGAPHWTVRFGRSTVLRPAPLGIVPAAAPFAGGFKEIGSERRSGHSTWRPVWGKFAVIEDHYNELTWKLQELGAARRRLEVSVRVYGDGIGVRYRLQGLGKLAIKDDNTHFAFAGDPTCWSANYERPSIGPVALSKYRGTQFPITLRVSGECYCSILEAAVFQSAIIVPKRVNRNTLRATLAESTLGNSGETSWRVVLIGKTPGALLTSTTMVNLNPRCVIEETSWIKPGLAMWDWRAWGGRGQDGFVYGLDMPSWKRQIDFASKHHLAYLILDAGWYGLESDRRSNPMTSRAYLLEQVDPKNPRLTRKEPPEDWHDPIDVPALIEYAKVRDVGIVLYVNDIARHHFDFPKTLHTYRRWGAAGIKYGFMRGAGQEKVLATRAIVKLCAENHLLCDFHDSPIPPSGDRRTYPNYLVREFCHGQADATRSFSPATFCTTVFCNMLAGPLDMCNGFFTLDGVEKVRPKVFSPINSTVVAEAARVLIVFSGLAILPDTPESYTAKKDLFEFVAKLPMTWDETKILNASIGHYITTARRSGDQWFVGSCCDQNGAELSVPLDFLNPGVTYVATVYEDGPNAHFMKNKETYRIRRQTVSQGATITARLAPGGGHCVYLHPIGAD